jgi:hypothetical protein
MTSPTTITLTPAAPDKELRATLYDWGNLSLTSYGPRGGFASMTVPAASLPQLAELISSSPLDNQRQDGAAPMPFDIDDEGKNDDRAEWALQALETFQAATGTDDGDAISDLVADLLHLCDREGERFGWSARDQIERGIRAYHQEITDDAPEELEAADVVGADA